MEKNEEIPFPRFLGQWTAGERPSWALKTTLPSCTIPDQTMTIQEIIAKYTRTGLVPASRAQWDQGGNDAGNLPEDPLDEYTEILELARSEGARAGSEVSPAPSQGEGGDPSSLKTDAPSAGSE